MKEVEEKRRKNQENTELPSNSSFPPRPASSFVHFVRPQSRGKEKPPFEVMFHESRVL